MDFVDKLQHILKMNTKNLLQNKNAFSSKK
jgi:hypothetical protein